MLMIVVFMAILLRLVQINRSPYTDAAQSQSSRTLIIGTTRGKIYDRNRQLLVDNGNRLVAAVTPVASAVKQLGYVFSSESLLKKIEKGYPFVATVKKEISTELVRTFKVPVRYSDDCPADHVVGYIDSSGKGVTGIEAAFDKELSAYAGKLSVTFEVDAVGRVLAGMDKTVTDENFNSPGGVILTLDKDIQYITEKAIGESEIKSGCAVVMDADTGDILSLASIPDFDRNNIENSFDKENAPLMNKALSSYSAGSVFKSIVAAFALEEGISENFTCECEGSVNVGNKQFNCYGQTAHGKVDMAEALQKSCNIYFIRLFEKLDTEKFLDFCRELGFGQSIRLCSTIESETGELPDSTVLSVPEGRANFAFGQGDLLVTPLQLVKAYNVLATGYLTQPALVYGFCDDKNNVTDIVKNKRIKLLNEKTVTKISRMLYLVTEKGIATNAKSEIVKLAGKTGTAESGVYNAEGEEIYRTWFAGFFPEKNPHYIVVVMNEDGAGGNADCAPVFKKICEDIDFKRNP